MRKLIRRGLTILIVLVVGIVGIQVVQQNSAQADGQEAANLVEDEAIAELGDLSVTVSATGAIAPIRQVGLAFEVSAPVREVLVQEGQIVHTGDILARLEAADLEAGVTDAQIGLETQQVAYDVLTAPAREEDIAVAQAALNAARASAGAVMLGPDETQLEISRLQTEIARNQLWQAQLENGLNFAQQEATAEQAARFGIQISVPKAEDVITPQIEQAEYGVQIADTNYSDTQNQGADVAGLSAANAQIVAAQAQLDRLLNGPSEMDLQLAEIQLQIAQRGLDLAEVSLDRAQLQAPFDGVIAQNNLILGETPPQGIAMQLIDTSSYYVDVGVDETDILNIQVGQKARLDLDALPDTDITGTVTRVAVTPVRVGQLVSYMVRVTLDPTDSSVRVGMTATATIIVNELHHVLTVPNRFIRIDRATQQAYITIERSNGGFEEVPVQLGLRNETYSQIISGLEEGQRVVLLPRRAWNPIG